MIENKLNIDFNFSDIFESIEIINLNYKKIVPYLNKKVLYYVRWQLRGEKEHILNDYLEKYLEMIKDYKFKGIYGFFKYKVNYENENKDSIFVYRRDEKVSLYFGKKKGENLSLVDYFENQVNILPLYIVTSGESLDELLKKLYKNDNYFDYFMMYGLLAELVEALAEFVHEKIIDKIFYFFNNVKIVNNMKLLKPDEVKYDEVENIKQLIVKKNFENEIYLKNLFKIYNSIKKNKKDITKIFKRYSFGYPCCPDVEQQKKLVKILNGNKIGVKTTSNGMLIPELSTAGFVILNKKDIKFE